MNVLNWFKVVDKEMVRGSKFNLLEFLCDFYIKVYKVMCFYMREKNVIVFYDVFELKVWKDFMREEEFKNVVLDIY